jgi:hypothetical protein
MVAAVQGIFDLFVDLSFAAGNVLVASLLPVIRVQILFPRSWMQEGITKAIPESL